MHCSGRAKSMFVCEGAITTRLDNVRANRNKNKHVTYSTRRSGAAAADIAASDYAAADDVVDGSS